MIGRSLRDDEVGQKNLQSVPSLVPVPVRSPLSLPSAIILETRSKYWCSSCLVFGEEVEEDPFVLAMFLEETKGNLATYVLHYHRRVFQMLYFVNYWFMIMSCPLKQSPQWPTIKMSPCPHRPDEDVCPASGMMMLSRRSEVRGAGLRDHCSSTSRPKCFRPQLYADVLLAAGELATFVSARPIRSHRSLSEVQVDFDFEVDDGVGLQVEQVVHLLLDRLELLPLP